MKKSVSKVIFLSFILAVILKSAVNAQVSTVIMDDADIKFSLQSYSFGKLLNDRIKERGPGISLEELMDYTKEQGFKAIDLTGYYFPGYPDPPSDDYLAGLKLKADELGLAISGIGVRNDFATTDTIQRASDVKHVKEWIGVADKLGAPVIRIFAGKLLEQDTPDNQRKRLAITIRECIPLAQEKGVKIGIQNHGEVLRTADDVLELIKMVNSDWFGVIVDSGYFPPETPYAEMKKVMPYAVNFLLKESPNYANPTIPINLEVIMKMLKEENYNGYVLIETLSSKGKTKDKKLRPSYDPYIAVPHFFVKVLKAYRENY